MGKSVITLVKSSVKEVRDDLKSQAKSLGNLEQLADLNVVNKESAPPASDAKLNERKELVVHNSEEKKLAPLRDSSKGKAVAIIDKPWNELVKYQEEGGSYPKIPKLKSFITPEGPLFQEEYNNQIREIKRLNDLKAEQEKSEEEFRKLFNPAKRLGLSPPPELATFGLTAEEKEMKMTELIKEVFVTENVWVNGMDINLIPSLGIMPIQGLVINEPESGIFFINENTDICFQRKSEFHLTPTIELIRLQRQIKKEYAEVLRRVRGGNTLTIQSPFEEEQSELEDCSLK
nr:hypothetical protein [Tanacetum cinerariifolium]